MSSNPGDWIRFLRFDGPSPAVVFVLVIIVHILAIVYNRSLIAPLWIATTSTVLMIGTAARALALLRRGLRL